MPTNKEKFPARMRESELIALVKKGSSEITDVEAFKELARRRVKTLPQLACKIVARSKSRPELRNAAAVALGKSPGSAQQRELIKALKSRDALLVRKVSASLGRIGDRAALAALEKKHVSATHAAAGTIGFAKTLISYRLGLAKNLLKPVASNRKLKVTGRRTFEASRVGRAALKKEIKQIRAQLPGMAISDKDAVKFTCDDCECWLVFNSDFADPAFRAGLKSRSAIAAAIVKLDACGGDRYVDEYLVTNPLKTASASLIGVRPSGIVVHSGQFSADGKDIEFSLQSANTRHSVAIDFVGRYATEKPSVTFAKARVLLGLATGQKRPRAPKRDA